MDKYKINSCFEKLNYEDYKILSRILHKALGVSMNTAKNYRKIQIGDAQDIPYEIGRKLEIMFGIEKEGISNEKISCKSYLELIKEEKKKLENEKLPIQDKWLKRFV